MTSMPFRRSASAGFASRRSRTRTRALASTGLALASWVLGVAAFAHDSPDGHWCSVDGSSTAPQAVVEIGRFDFSGAQMRTFANQLANVPGSCGQVDHTDEWNCAKQIAEAYCTTLSASQSLDQVALPIFAGPAPALADDHHQRYRLAAGLYGACVACGLNRETPASQDD